MGYLWCQCPQVGYPEYPPYLFSGTSAGRRRFYCGSARRWFPACCRAGTGRSFSTSGGRACRFSDDRRTDYHARHRPRRCARRSLAGTSRPSAQVPARDTATAPGAARDQTVRKCAYSAAAPRPDTSDRTTGYRARRFWQTRSRYRRFSSHRAGRCTRHGRPALKWSMVYRRRSAVYAVKKSS